MHIYSIKEPSEWCLYVQLEARCNKHAFESFKNYYYTLGLYNLNFLISQKYSITSTNSVSFYTKQNELTKSVLDLGLKTEFEIKKVTVICKLSSDLIF